MTQKRSPNLVVGAVDRNPEVARLFGVFLADFATLELLLMKLMALALKEDENMPMSHVVCGRIRNVADRALVVKECIERSALAPEKKSSAMGFVDEILKLNAKRNEYVHGLWETDNVTTAVMLTPYVTTAGRQGQMREIHPQEIKEQITLVRSLVARTISTLFASGIETFQPPSSQGKPS